MVVRTIQELYEDFKTLIKQSFYDKNEIDTFLSGKSDSNHTHTKSQITDFPTIPSKISDLTNDSDFIETSNTSGLIKNDGTIDTNTYLTSHQSLSNYYTKSEIDNIIGDIEEDMKS